MELEVLRSNGFPKGFVVLSGSFLRFSSVFGSAGAKGSEER
jgi:hypothetical protein